MQRIPETMTEPPYTGTFVLAEEGTPLGSITTLDVRGPATASVSGSYGTISIDPEPAEQIGIMGQDEGIPLGTGTTLNVIGPGATLSRSGTVLELSVPGSGTVWDDGFTLIYEWWPVEAPLANGRLAFGNPTGTGNFLRLAFRDAAGGYVRPLFKAWQRNMVSFQPTWDRGYLKVYNPAAPREYFIHEITNAAENEGNNNAILGVEALTFTVDEWPTGTIVAASFIPLATIYQGILVSEDGVAPSYATGTRLDFRYGLTITGSGAGAGDILVSVEPPISGSFVLASEGQALGSVTTLNVVGEGATVSVSGAYGELRVGETIAGDRELPSPAWYPSNDSPGFASARMQVKQSTGSVPSPRFVEWLFHPALNEYALVDMTVPEDYQDHPRLRVDFKMASGTSGIVEWGTRCFVRAPGGNLDADGAIFQAAAMVTGIVPAVAGQEVSAIATLTATGMLAGNRLNLLLYRNATGTVDTANGDAEFVGASFLYDRRQATRLTGSFDRDLATSAWYPSDDSVGFAAARAQVKQSTGSVPSPRFVEWLFHPALNEYLVLEMVVPQNYSEDARLEVDFKMASGTSGLVEWGARCFVRAPGGNLDADGAVYQAAAMGTGIVPAVAGVEQLATVALNATGIFAGDRLNLLLYRNATGTVDTGNGDAEFAGARFVYVGA